MNQTKDSHSDNSKIYRLRSTEKLLGEHKELDRQSLYFARPEELNDPMEGYHHFFWMGDKIAWTNFFRHFVYNVYQISLINRLSVFNTKFSEEIISIYGNMNDLPTQDLANTYEKIYRNVSENTNLNDYITTISKQKYRLSQEEIQFCLEQLASVIDMEIGRTLTTDEPGPDGKSYHDFIKGNLPENYMITKSQFQQIEQFQMKKLNAREACMNSIYRTKLARAKLLHERRSKLKKTIYQNTPFRLDFPSTYINYTKRESYPDWSTVCFMRETTNPSTWAHYGDKHRGACLIFDAPTDNNGRNYLNLTNTKHQNDIKIEFKDVTYRGKSRDTNFFQALSFILNKPELSDIWFKDSKGKLSNFHYNSDNKKERAKKFNNHIINFFHNVSTKTKDWRYEKETRLILLNTERPLAEIEDRTFSYTFENLHGVIFGTHTQDHAIAETIDIIKRKLRENSRTDFKFYQAYYSPKEGKIEMKDVSKQILKAP